MRYELRIVDERGKVLATDSVEAANDKDAVDAARRKYPIVQNIHYKIWQDCRLVTLRDDTRFCRVAAAVSERDAKPHVV